MELLVNVVVTLTTKTHGHLQIWLMVLMMDNTKKITSTDNNKFWGTDFQGTVIEPELLGKEKEDWLDSLIKYKKNKYQFLTRAVKDIWYGTRHFFNTQNSY